MVAFNDANHLNDDAAPGMDIADWSEPAYRCYGLMDSRGRWGSWLFGLSTPAELARLEREAAQRNKVLFLSAQTFAPPEGRRPKRWRQAREHYVGENPLPHLAPFFFDVDSAGDLGKALLAGRYLLEFLVHGLELGETAVRIWFSGSKGLHILVHPAAMGVEPSPMLTADMKRIVASLVKRLEAEGCPELPVDSAVYSLPRMLRAPNQVNPKSGLYKIELRHEELLRLTGDEIKALATEPRAPLWPEGRPPPVLSPTAAAWWATEIGRLRETRDFTRRTAELTGRKVRPDGFVFDELIDDEMPDCIRQLAATTVAPGNRNRAELQLACWALAAGRPRAWATRLLATWAARNRPELTLDGCRAKAESVVAAVYGRSGYGFSCAAARTAAHAAGLDPGCATCRAVRRPALRILHSLRRHHDEGWVAPERITLHDARVRIADFIDSFIGGAAGASGAHVAGNGQDLRRPAGSGRPRGPRPLRHADTRTGRAG